ncbi:hypothetical protein JF50_10500 [Pseudoalteromonas luteoviolacea]|uniref:Uncharacterized protein n=1 Tax=Pseudoalteromonas luteoviolacea TaxID=43657 RepID=A0A0C1MS86_9GAMM|nr:hypothetical protein [Pseudoalteromonas luteoviolacea]KID57598.1 hypothetical protein JF50_10500 [Pseudoalteromonas luteoviolacea]
MKAQLYFGTVPFKIQAILFGAQMACPLLYLLRIKRPSYAVQYIVPGIHQANVSLPDNHHNKAIHTLTFNKV